MMPDELENGMEEEKENEDDSDRGGKKTLFVVGRGNRARGSVQSNSSCKKWGQRSLFHHLVF